MTHTAWPNFWRRLREKSKTRKPIAGQGRNRLGLERLEERMLLVTTTWTGLSAFSNHWSDDANWMDEDAPGLYVPEAVDMVFPAGATNLVNVNDLGGGLTFNSITIAGTGYVLTGDPILDTPVRTTNSAGPNTIVLAVEGDTIFDVANLAATLVVSSGIGNVTSDTVTKNGHGTLRFAADNAYFGVTTINDGRLQIADGVDGLAETGPVVVVASGELDVGNGESFGALSGDGIVSGSGGVGVFYSSNATFAGAFDISGNLSKSGPGTLTLAGSVSNTIGGTVRVNEGKLVLAKTGGATAVPGPLVIGDSVGGPSADVVQLNGSNQIADASRVIVSISGELRLNGNSDTIVDLTMTAGNVSTGAGTLRLQGGVNTIPAATSATINGNLSLGNGQRSFEVADGAASPDLIVSAGISGDPFAGLIMNGAGTLLLAGANSYTGPTTIYRGAVLLQDGVDALSNETAVTVALGATLDVGNGEAFGSLAGAGNVTGAGAVNVGANNSSTTFSGVISVSGDFVKQGTGTMTLAGSSPNTFTGTTRVNAGMLVLNKTGATAVPGPLVIGDGTGGTESDRLRLMADNQIGSSSVTVNSSGKFDLFGHSDAIGSLTMTGGSVFTGGGTLTLGGDVTTNASDMPASIDGRLSLGSLTRSFRVANGTAPEDLIVLAEISGGAAAGLTKAGTGTLRLDATNSYPGATTINAGTLRLGAGNNVPKTSAVTIATDTTLDLDDETETIGSLAGAGTVELGIGTLAVGGNNTSTTFSGRIEGTGGLTKTGTGTLTLGAATAYTGATLVAAGTLKLGDTVNALTSKTAVTVASGATLDVGSGGEQFGSLAGDGDVIGGGVSVGGNDESTTFSGIISVAGGITKEGAGTFTLAGPNEYQGLTTVNAGALRLGAPNAVPDASGVVLATATAFDLNGFSDTIGSLTLTGASVATGTGTLTIAGNVASNPSANSATITGKLSLGGATRAFVIADGAAANDLLVSAIISNGVSAAGLTKDGPGRLVLTGFNSYIGTTTLNAGTMLIQGTQPSSAVSLAGGTLGGTGTVSTISTSGGTVSPGSSTGILNVQGGVALAAATTYRVELNGTTPGVGYDQLRVSGGGAGLLVGPLDVSVGFANALGDTFTIINNVGSDPIPGRFAGLPEGSTFTAGRTEFQIRYAGGTGNDVVLTVVQPNTPLIVTAPANQTAPEGTATNFNLGSFTDPVGTGPWQVTVDWGDGKTDTSFSVGATGTLPTQSHTFADDASGPFTVSVNVAGADGVTDTKSFEVAVSNVLPVVTAPSNQAAVEGTETIFNLGSFIDPGADAAWQVTVNWGDGTPDTVFNESSAGALPSRSHRYADDSAGPFTVTVRVTDNDGGSNTASFQVAVSNVSPLVTPTSDRATDEGTSTSFDLGSFADRGGDSPWRVTVNWGDGTANTDFDVMAAGPLPPQLHTFAADAAGPFTVQVSVADGDGPPGAAMFRVAVADVPPALAPVADQSAGQGVPKDFDLGSFTDPGADGPWTVTVNWGDNSTNTTFPLRTPGAISPRSHSFLDAAQSPFPVSVTVADKDGSADTRSFSVTVVAGVTFTVNSTGDAGDGSTADGVCDTGQLILRIGVPEPECTLRAALQQANASGNIDSTGDGDPDPDLIAFDVPGSGVHSIAVGSGGLGALPNIIDRMVIDGTTQPGASANTQLIGDNARLLIELDGSTVTSTAGGLTLGRFGSPPVNTDGSVIRGLVINRFRDGGIILVRTAFSVIEGNFIGTDASGTIALGNGGGGGIVNSQEGVSNNTIGGVTPAARNVIVGRPDVPGQTPSGSGISFAQATLTFPMSGNVIQGNYVGLNAAGTGKLGILNTGIELTRTSNTQVGGSTIVTRNVVAGSGSADIHLSDAIATTLHGNYVGTDATGTVALPGRPGNGLGIHVLGTTQTAIGGSGPGEGNLISGHNHYAVWLDNTNGVVVQGNLIGTGADGACQLDAQGKCPLGNGAYGVFVDVGFNNVGFGSNNLIGGTSPGEGNVIAYNGFNDPFLGGKLYPGIEINGRTGNRILGNSIHSNNGLGIDLGRDFVVTANDVGDGDTGPNRQQNFPALTSVTATAGELAIGGTLNSTANTAFRVEFFANDDCEASQHGEGRTFLGFTNVTTDSGGNAIISATLAGAGLEGKHITATATDPNGNTSEFSMSKMAGTPPAFEFIAANFDANEGDGTVQITVRRTGGLGGAYTVLFATANGSAVAGADYRVTLATLRFAAGQSEASVAVPLIEDSDNESPETVNLTLSSPSCGAVLGSQSTATLTIADIAEDRPNLVVLAGEIIVPPTGLAGEDISVSFTVHNESGVELSGTWTDGLFLSLDGVLDAADSLIGRLEHTGGLAAHASYRRMLTTPLPAAVEAGYRVIVVTDSRNDVIEERTSDNFAASTGLIGVQYPLIPLDGSFAGILAAGFDRYFRVNVPADTDVRLSAEFSLASGVLLLERFGTPPKFGDEAGPAGQRPGFDQLTSAASHESLELLLRGPAGPHYVLLSGRQLGTGESREFTVSARRPMFEAGEFKPRSGANVGPVTITVHGSGFSAGSTATLLSQSDGTTVAADAVVVKDSNTLFATFDLTGVTLGDYAIRVANPGAATMASRFFQVRVGSPGRVVMSLTTPGRIRPFLPNGVPLALSYANPGDTDVTAPIIRIVAVCLRFDPTTETRLGLCSPTSSGEIAQVLGVNPDGPAATLPPGFRGSMTLAVNLPFSTRAGDQVEFTAFVVDPQNPNVDLSFFKVSLMPPGVTAEAWDVIFDNLVARIGATSTQYQAVIAETANRLSELGETTSDVSRLLNLVLQQANNSLPGLVLARSRDAGLAGPRGTSLALDRVFRQPISSRYRLGDFGRGWRQTWDATARLLGNVVLIDTTQGIRTFLRQNATNRFRSVQGDSSTVDYSPSGQITLHQPDGTTFTFFGHGGLAMVEDSAGNRITTSYSDGKISGLLHSDGDSITFSRNAAGRITAVTDSAGRTTTYAYDAAGEHLLSAAGPAGTTEYGYVTGVGPASEHGLASVTLPDRTHAFFDYDSAGQLIRIRHDDGRGTVEIDYVRPGEFTMRDAAGSASFRTNSAGQLAEQCDSLGRCFRVEYNADRRPVRIIRPDGLAVFRSFDGRGNIVEQFDPLGNSTRTGFDPAFTRLTSITDQRFRTTGYQYDTRGNLTTIVYPNGTSDEFGYDAAGNLVQHGNRRGETVTYSYNARGQLVRRDHGDGSHEDFSYDAHGNMVAASDSSGTTTFDYDAADRVMKVTYSNGRSVEYVYNAGGRLAGLVHHDGFAVNYEYDSAGRMARVTEGSGASLVEYSYDAAGRLMREDKGNGTATSYEYDAAGQLMRITNLAPDATVNSQFDYSYDTLNRRVAETSPDGTWSYEYDAIGQLTHALFNATNPLLANQDLRYEYDAAGNRVRTTSNGVSTDYLTNDLNQYTSVGSGTLGFDADGNIAERTDDVESATYAFDDMNRLQTVASAAGTWSFEYDALGNRTATVHDGARTEYLVQPAGLSDVFAEYDGAGDLVARYVYGVGLVERIGADGTASFYDFDAVGSARGLSGPDGAYQNEYSYLPFGERFGAAASGVPNPFTFVGRFGVTRDGSGLDFMRSRYYDSTDGRFINQDPIGVLGGLNLYRYVGNQPTDLIDPSGLVPPFVSLGIVDAALESTAWDTFVSNTTVDALAGASATESSAVAELALAGDATLVDGLAVGVATESGIGGAAGGFVLLDVVVVPLAVVVAAGAGFAAGTFQNATFIEPLTPDNYNVGDAACDLVGCDQDDFGPLPSLGVPGNGGGGGGGGGGGMPGGDSNSFVATSLDPNDIIGPAGVGDASFVRELATLPYLIHFENLRIATAPAQRVEITQQLDTDLDLASFEFGDLGFGDTVIHVPAGRQFYSTRIELPTPPEVLQTPVLPGQLPPASTFFLDVSTGLDFATGAVTWTFTSLDANTFDLPDDPLLGFLPPNQTTPEGEGFVSYFVRPKSDLPTGTRLDAQATIVFDTNAPLDTPAIFNTIDAGDPASSVNPLPAVTTSASFPVSWTGSDDAGGPAGSGISFFDIFVSDNGGPFTAFQSRTSASSAMFTGQFGHTYSFFSSASDNVGHQQPTSASAQASTILDRPPTLAAITLNPAGNRSVTSVKLTFSELLAVNASSVPTNATNYRLLGAGRDKLPGTLALPGDDTTLAITRATLGDANTSVTLTLARPIKAGQLFRVVIFANGPLTDSVGNHFDGNGDGTLGDTSSTTLTRGTKISFTDSDRDKVTLTLSGGGVMQLTLAPSRDALALALVGANSNSVLNGTVRKPKIGATAANGKTPRPTITNPNGARINLTNPPFVPNLSAIVIDRLLESRVALQDLAIESL